MSRRRAKNTRVRQGEALTIKETRDIIAQKEAEEQVRRDERFKEGGQNERQSSVRRCNLCGTIGHNARTCQDTIVVSTLYILSSLVKFYILWLLN